MRAHLSDRRSAKIHTAVDDEGSRREFRESRNRELTECPVTGEERDAICAADRVLDTRGQRQRRDRAGLFRAHQRVA